MYKSLNTGMVGIQAGVMESIDLAGRCGFGGVDLAMKSVAEVAGSLGVAAVRERFAAAGIRPGAAGLPPGRVSVSEEEWATAIRELPPLAALAQQIGYTRSGIVVLPFHETLDWQRNFDLHVRRLREMATVLDGFGIRLGCEYVSQLTRRAPYEHHFIHDMKGILELCAAAGRDNLGLMFDTFHWYCAGETAADIEALRAEQVITVHVADGPPGRRLEEHVAFERALPGQTGVIDLKAAGCALRRIGYDGPITCEPFCKLSDVPADQAAATLSAALDTILL
jgi:sugar phosphate isomerase/epimerase